MFCPVFVSGSQCGVGGRRKTLRLRLKAAADAGSPEAVTPSGLRGGADQTPSAGLSNPIVSGCQPTGKTPRSSSLPVDQRFQVACAAVSKRVLLTDRAYVRSGRWPERCRKPCHGANMQLNSALFDISKEMQRRRNKTKQEANERKKKQ